MKDTGAGQNKCLGRWLHTFPKVHVPVLVGLKVHKQVTVKIAQLQLPVLVPVWLIRHSRCRFQCLYRLLLHSVRLSLKLLNGNIDASAYFCGKRTGEGAGACVGAGYRHLLKCSGAGGFLKTSTKSDSHFSAHFLVFFFYPHIFWW